MKRLLLTACVLFFTVSYLNAMESQALAAVKANAEITRSSLARHFKSGSTRAENIAAYLFNMYLLTKFLPADGSKGLTLGHLGAMDPLYKYRVHVDFNSFCLNNIDKIKEHLKNYFKESGMKYASSRSDGDANTKQELVFLSMLANSKGENDYFYTGGVPPLSIALSLGLANSISKRASAAMEGIKNKAVLIAPNDIMFVWSHMKAVDDCTVSSHTICKNICGDNKQYSGWKLIASYQIRALPGEGQEGLFTAAGGSNFKAKSGKLYQQWRYHLASVFVLEKNGNIVYIAADGMLLDNPERLDKWISLFSPKSRFTLEPFDPDRDIPHGKEIRELLDVPDYIPYISPYKN